MFRSMVSVTLCVCVPAFILRISIIGDVNYRIAENIGGCKTWRRGDCLPNFGAPK